MRYDEAARAELASEFHERGFVVLRGHFAPATLETWRTAFAPLLERHVRTEADTANRGAQRFYVTLPFRAPFDDAKLYADPDVLELCRLLVGRDLAMCRLADALPLFPELDSETPPYQLAVNVPLVDVTGDNGPTEIAAGTHNAPKDAGLARIARGEVSLGPVPMRVGDVMVRGTRNRTAHPRPMVVIGYSRAWLARPEVSVRIARSTWKALSEDLRYLLRANPIVPDDRLEPGTKRIARSLTDDS